MTHAHAIMRGWIPMFVGMMISLFLIPAAHAAPSPSAELSACLRKAEELPDAGEANALRWLKQGGGEDARFCHAVAQFNRNEFKAAGDEFAALAKLHDRTDPRHATELHTRAGLSYMRADDTKDAEDQYALALELEPDDPDIWVDRATERANHEKYWDAIGDLNHALAIEPDMTEALRLRGQCWVKLDNLTNALADFGKAKQIDDEDKAKKHK